MLSCVLLCCVLFRRLNTTGIYTTRECRTDPCLHVNRDDGRTKNEQKFQSSMKLGHNLPVIVRRVVVDNMFCCLRSLSHHGDKIGQSSTRKWT